MATTSSRLWTKESKLGGIRRRAPTVNSHCSLKKKSVCRSTPNVYGDRFDTFAIAAARPTHPNAVPHSNVTKLEWPARQNGKQDTSEKKIGRRDMQICSQIICGEHIVDKSQLGCTSSRSNAGMSDKHAHLRLPFHFRWNFLRNAKNCSQSWRRDKKTNLGEHSAARLSFFWRERRAPRCNVGRRVTRWDFCADFREIAGRQGRCSLARKAILLCGGLEGTVTGGWVQLRVGQDQETCYFWRCPCAEMSRSWESSSWGPKVEAGPMWSRWSRSVVPCAEVLRAQSDGPMYRYEARVWLAANFFFQYQPQRAACLWHDTCINERSATFQNKKSMTVVAQDKNGPNKSMASWEHEWWLRCLDRWWETGKQKQQRDMLVTRIAEHRIQTLHRCSVFFQSVFCVGSLFFTCVRCHAARGVSRASQKENCWLQVKQNATNTWRHSWFFETTISWKSDAMESVMDPSLETADSLASSPRSRSRAVRKWSSQASWCLEIRSGEVCGPQRWVRRTPWR